MSLAFVLLVALLGAPVLIGLAAWQWRAAGRALIFILIFEGVFRKWLFPAASDYIYFAKDLVLIGALLGLWRARRFPPMSWHGYRGWLLLLTPICVIGAVNPIMGSPIAGAVGLKAWLLWPLFVFLVPSLFETIDELWGYLRRIFLVSVPLALLAIAQFNLPPDHILNQYVRDASVVTFGEVANVRVCATFSYLAGFTNYLAFFFAMFVPVFFHPASRRVQIWLMLLLPLVAGAALMTGARFIFFFIGLFTVGFVAIATLSGLVRVRQTLLPSSLVLVICSAAVVAFFADARTAMFERVINVTATGDNFFTRTYGTLIYAFLPHVFTVTGDGIGSAHQGARAAADALGQPVQSPMRELEAETERVMAETGIAGFFVWYSFKAYLVALAFLQFRRRRLPILKALTLASGLYQILVYFSSPIFDHSLAPFFWFVVSLVFACERLERLALTMAPGISMPLVHGGSPGWRPVWRTV